MVYYKQQQKSVAKCLSQIFLPSFASPLKVNVRELESTNFNGVGSKDLSHEKKTSGYEIH